MDKYILIVAGGKGERMGSKIPKQFIEIDNLPIIMHTIGNFIKIDKNYNIIIVLPQKFVDYWKELISKFNFNIKHKIVIGGDTRFDSVKNGLKNIFDDNSLVAIHDSVRPFINDRFVKNGFEIAEKKGNAIPYVDITESIRFVENTQNKPVDRDKYKIIQTPQFFISGIIKKAYNQRYKKEFTDDASVLESIKISINLFKGIKQNLKITTQDDLALANFYLKNNLL